MEQQPTKETAIISPPPFVDDPALVKRSLWVVDKYLPFAIENEWVYGTNAARKAEGYLSITQGDLSEKEFKELKRIEINKLLFVDHYDDAAAMYIKRIEEKQGTN